MSPSGRILYRTTSFVCAIAIAAAALWFLAGAAHAEDQLRTAFSNAVFLVDQRSAQTPNGVVVFDSNANPILVPGAGGKPQQAPGVG
jgi:hypothetical protein